MRNYQKIMVFTASVNYGNSIINFIDTSFNDSGAIRVNKSIPQAIIDSGAIDRITKFQQVVPVHVYYALIPYEKLCDCACRTIKKSFYTGEMYITDLKTDLVYVATFDLSINKKLNNKYAEYVCRTSKIKNNRELDSRMWGAHLREFYFVSWTPKYYNNWSEEYYEDPEVNDSMDVLKFYADSIAEQL